MFKFNEDDCLDLHVGGNIEIFVFALSEVKEKKYYLHIQTPFGIDTDLRLKTPSQLCTK